MTEDKTYMRIRAADNNEYICPLEIAQKNTPLGEDQLDDCVEAEVAGRYIGHLKMRDSA